MPLEDHTFHKGPGLMLHPGLTLTLCRLEREADFRGGVFFGLNVFPKRGISDLMKERSMLLSPRVRKSQGYNELGDLCNISALTLPFNSSYTHLTDEV
ncbi:hypothetical protein Cadr_000017439 [Camelus dromedarius]|uniref:Uncharacterized protein n=1 Tax=Camelus dromedarius TaxID=9838 RepID=A0A5N4DFJ0_CAMDR|nr:hypothetical protein Cadr_000017439 [Camelus dromedarius]